MLLLLIYNKKGADSHEPAPQSMKSNENTKKMVIAIYSESYLRSGI